MKKILLTSFVGILAVSAASAMTFAPYAAVRGGYNMTNVSNNFDDLDVNGFLVSGALGLELYSDTMFGIRAEAEYNYITADIDFPNSNGADTTNSTVLANFFADFKTDSVITPYVSLGIVYGWTTIEDEEKINDSNIAWQLGAGITYVAMDNFMIDLGYRYLNSTTFTIEDPDGDIDSDITSHQIYLGARYAF